MKPTSPSTSLRPLPAYRRCSACPPCPYTGGDRRRALNMGIIITFLMGTMANKPTKLMRK